MAMSRDERVRVYWVVIYALSVVLVLLCGAALGMYAVQRCPTRWRTKLRRWMGDDELQDIGEDRGTDVSTGEYQVSCRERGGI